MNFKMCNLNAHFIIQRPRPIVNILRDWSPYKITQVNLQSDPRPVEASKCSKLSLLS